MPKPSANDRARGSLAGANPSVLENSTKHGGVVRDFG